jgi:photosystem II stability/assembly factor-like uncharacterized protein
MKANFGAIVVAGIGKLGGQVFSRSGAGVILKRKVSPINRNSQLQLNVRSRMSSISSTWHSLLESQRTLWNAFANDRPYSNDFGQTIHLSGFGMFCKLNANRASIYLSLLTTPPMVISLYQITQVSALSLSIDQVILITIAPTIPAGTSIKVFASDSLNPGISKFYGTYILLGTIDNSSPSPIDISSMYLSKFKAVGAAGQKIFLKLIAIDQGTGLESQPFEIVSIISDLNYSNIGLYWSDLGSQGAQQQLYRFSYMGKGIVLAASATVEGHILRSIDLGLTWTDLGRLLGSIGVFSMDTDHNGIVLAGIGTTSAKIAKSTDDGLTWVDKGQLGTDTTVYSILPLGNSTWLAATGSVVGRVYMSRDDGETWSLKQSLTGSVRIYALALLSENIIIAGTSTDGHIWKSTDGGSTWLDKGRLGTIGFVQSLCNLGNGICLAGMGSSGPLWRSVDYGESWTSLGQLYGQTAISCMTYCGNGVVVIGTNGTGLILRSTDYGLNWTNLGTMFGESRVNAIQYIITGLCLAGTFNHEKILRSTI